MFKVGKKLYKINTSCIEQTHIEPCFSHHNTIYLGRWLSSSGLTDQDNFTALVVRACTKTSRFISWIFQVLPISVLVTVLLPPSSLIKLIFTYWGIARVSTSVTWNEGSIDLSCREHISRFTWTTGQSLFTSRYVISHL